MADAMIKEDHLPDETIHEKYRWLIVYKSEQN